MKRVENLGAWRQVMKEIQERLKGPLFTPSQTVWSKLKVVVGGADVADCCYHMSAMMAQRSPGPAKVQAHLRTVGHFQRWCLSRSVEKVLRRFPEVKPLLAERELLR